MRCGAAHVFLRQGIPGGEKTATSGFKRRRQNQPVQHVLWGILALEWRVSGERHVLFFFYAFASGTIIGDAWKTQQSVCEHTIDCDPSVSRVLLPRKQDEDHRQRHGKERRLAIFQWPI
jgi:hypothetical protein